MDLPQTRWARQQYTIWDSTNFLWLNLANRFSWLQKFFLDFTNKPEKGCLNKTTKSKEKRIRSRLAVSALVKFKRWQKNLQLENWNTNHHKGLPHIVWLAYWVSCKFRLRQRSQEQWDLNGEEKKKKKKLGVLFFFFFSFGNIGLTLKIFFLSFFL